LPCPASRPVSELTTASQLQQVIHELLESRARSTWSDSTPFEREEPLNRGRTWPDFEGELTCVRRALQPDDELKSSRIEELEARQIEHDVTEAGCGVSRHSDDRARRDRAARTGRPRGSVGMAVGRAA